MKPQINLDKNKKYLLACSFGPDSMCLFHILLSNGYDFDVAHVNYGLRSEAKKETENLTKYCEQNKVKIFTLNATVDKRKNIEEECRIIRYTFFNELTLKEKYDSVLVAHNEDDLLETYLMQKQRNICANNYGIAENITIFGIKVIRPLLSYKKTLLEEYCQENKVPYCIDSSNLTNDYLRNRIRHNIVSKMNNEERKKLMEEIDMKNHQHLEMIQSISKIDISNISDLLKLSENELQIALNILIRQHNPCCSISAKCCFEIRKILKSNKPNIAFNINEKVSFVKEYDKCYFVSNKKEATYEYLIEEPCVIDTEFFYFDLSKDLGKRNLSKSDFPITIRTYKAGDFTLVKNYIVPIRRMFIDYKMPISTRKRWPLIVNRYGIIKYVPRFRADFDIKNTPEFFVKL